MRDPFAPWVVALTHTGFGAGLPLSGRDWWPLFDPPPTCPSEIEFRMSRSANPAVQAIFARKRELESEIEDLESEGIFALTLFDKAFPAAWIERLGPRVPPVVFLRGDPKAFRQPALAIVGSRNAGEASLEFARHAARAAVEHDWAVVTGGANGVDKAAILAATAAGGTAIVIAADELDEIGKRLARDGVDASQLLLLTSGHPNSGWSVGKAMGRNKLIYALANCAIVAACEANTGGTWSGATEALRMEYCPVCVWTGDGSPAGNLELQKEGAVGITVPDGAFESFGRGERATLFD